MLNHQKDFKDILTTTTKNTSRPIAKYALAQTTQTQTKSYTATAAIQVST